MIDESKRWPESFPDRWASEWGEDEYGLWMAFHYEKLRHVMRWIEPGVFMMGSPEDELERDDNETLHQVTLPEGFWLGATTVTQELWQAVIGENLSRFQGKQRPVERVSWASVQSFLAWLNKEIFGLELSLPTDAQWEYACRAGKSTPFSFGNNINAEQVNFDGTYSYADGKKGEYRAETVEVNVLPCNNWGLYQMHGNVWELCMDRYAKEYFGGPVNPSGPLTGQTHVIRGGSWINGGRKCRSAVRNQSKMPAYPNNRVGFRLARGRTVRR